LVMGRKPEVEDHTPQRQIVNESESQMAWASFNPGASLFGHKDETFWKPVVNKDLRAQSFPGERFGGQQWTVPSEVDSSVHMFNKPNEVPTNDYRSLRSTETKMSKGGEILPDVAATHIEASKKKLDAINSNDPFGVSTCMSKVLEGVMSDASDSSSSIRIGVEYDSKQETTDKEKLQNLIRGVSVSSLSSNSMETTPKAMATNINPIHKLEVDDQDD